MTSMKGIALLVVVGILVLLSLAGVGMAAMAGGLRTQASVRLDRVQAGLLARSGVGYALSRLSRESRTPAPASPENQPDDWTCRDDPGIPLEAARNPSYARTEPYSDRAAPGSGAGAGRYDEGVDSYTDLNGDGRFDSWSGRLRGRYGMASGTFALRIEAAGAAINVNDGRLDPADHGNLDAGAPASPGSPDPTGAIPLQPISYWHPNLRLAELIDTLGEVRGLPADSGVGERIVSSRPPGGYRSVGQALAVLSRAERSALAGFLGAMPDREPAGHPRTIGNNGHYDRNDPDYRSPINLADAPPDLLQSLFQGLTWVRFSNGTAVYSIGANEAAALARFLVQDRTRTPFRGRADLYQRIHANRLSLFSGLPAKVFGTPTVDPADAIDTKVDLVDATANSEEVFAVLGNLSWYSFDAKRGIGLADSRLSRTTYRYQIYSRDYRLQRGISTELALDPEGSFRVESLGKAGGIGRLLTRLRAEAVVKPVSWIRVRSQADFENFENLRPSRGLPAGVAVEGRPLRDRIQSTPSWPMEELTDLAPPQLDYGFPLDDYGYPRYRGELRLMTMAEGYAGPGKEEPDLVFYAPAWESAQPLRVAPPVASYGDPFKGWVRAAAGTSSWRQVDYTVAVSSLDAHLLEVADELPDSYNEGTHGSILPGFPGPVTFQWDDAKDFPLIDPSGQVRRGSFLFWVQRLSDNNRQENPMRAAFGSGSSGLTGGYGALWQQSFPLPSTPHGPGPLPKLPGQIAVSVQSPVGVGPWVWFHAAFVFDGSTVAVYQDGVPVGVGEFEVNSVDAASVDYRQDYSAGDVRVYNSPLSQTQVGVHSKYRYWAPESAADLGLASRVGDVDLSQPPSFLSPLYRLPRGAGLLGARLDPFVPEALAQATIRMEVWIYSDPEGTRRVAAAAVDPTGLWTEFPSRPNAASFRYRIVIDAGAAAQAGAGPAALNDTPIVDGVTVGFRSASLAVASFQIE